MTRTLPHNNSSMAQWKRAGPITPRSLDRNKLLLKIFSTSDLALAVYKIHNIQINAKSMYELIQMILG